MSDLSDSLKGNGNVTYTAIPQANEQNLTGVTAEMQKLLDSFEQTVSLMQKLVYTNAEVVKMLGICANTLKKYRDNGYISYSRVDDKYFYSKKDIDEFLANTHYSAWHYQQ